METCSEHTLDQSLGEGKWSIKQIAGHLYDTKEVWSERIEKAISNDHTPFQSYDPEMYVKKRAYGDLTYKRSKH